MNEAKWIMNKYSYQELKSTKIQSILYFGLIWSIFEDEVCRNNAKISDSRILALKLMENITLSVKRKISLIWNYFYERYTYENGDIKEIFINFKFNSNDDKEFVTYALQKRKNASYEEKTEALLRIIFRLRNNLLHGEKDVSKLYEQNNNFKYANKFLMLMVDKK
ncbi:hypothetical protein [Hydrogenimonas cancrithermarum]|uniref:Apea-like HEPN domain-containing protein n=1 Tax=Hydrogenimonas cancrithermarum TaxID=2993563 RepID=A0ABN6WU10_9BACT|nr:hypothetical protein [Hydrogenimonas cancrithermarum]BDY12476.1 hypothetical protein HCR_07880 [Hydrogenimonas cancrithermarum]